MKVTATIVILSEAKNLSANEEILRGVYPERSEGLRMTPFAFPSPLSRCPAAPLARLIVPAAEDPHLRHPGDGR